MILNSSWSPYFIKVKNKICDTRRSSVWFFASHKMFKNHCPMSKCLVMADMKTKEENEKSRKHEKLTGPSYRREKRQELMACCSGI